MKSRFFLPSAAPDVARIAHALAARFLKPLVQFILVLIEPIARKRHSAAQNAVGPFSCDAAGRLCRPRTMG